MTLERKIQNRLKNIASEDVLKKMGYIDLTEAEKRLDLFKRINDIYLWLKLETHDTLYDSEDFIIKLLKVLDLYTSVAKNVLTQYRMKLHQLKDMEQPYIDIDTKFQRGNELMHELVKARKLKRIMLNKEDVAFSSLEENLEFVQEIMKAHYNRTKGDLGVWGKIHFYYYKASDGNIYGFDKYGEQL
jgi:hypothetical protein